MRDSILPKRISAGQEVRATTWGAGMKGKQKMSKFGEIRRIKKRGKKKGKKDYAKRLKKICDLYDRNFHRLVVYSKSCDCNADRCQPCSNKRHKRAILREKMLYNEEVRLRKKLGIYIYDPCPQVKISCQKCEEKNGGCRLFKTRNSVK